MQSTYGHRKCKSLVEVVRKESFDNHTHGIITRNGRVAGVKTPMLLLTNENGEIVAATEYHGDFVIHGNLTAALINGENYSETMAALRDAIANSSVSELYKVRVSTAWEGEAAPYRQVIAIDGITESDTPIVTLIKNGDTLEEVTAQETAYNQIYRIVTQSGKIVILSKTIPATEIDLQLKVIR